MVSVLIPTYRRLPFLKRAVEDVFAQTCADWELIVTDDEVDEGETWTWLKGLAARESRVRIVKNEGSKHGQVYNVNNGLRACRGDWIKILFDDDRMLPTCLEKMLAVANRFDQIKQSLNQTIQQFPLAMIGCRAQKWRNGQYIGDEKDYTQTGAKGQTFRASFEMIPQSCCRLAICKFDRWNGRTPTHMLINRKAIDAGALMPEGTDYKVPVDWVWFADILEHGAYAMMRDVLVHQREGEVASITGTARSSEDSLDEELRRAYRDIYEKLAPAQRRHFSRRDLVAEINGIRGIYHLKCRRFSLGLKMILKMFLSARGPLLSLRWLLQETFPHHFAATTRLNLAKQA